LNSFGFVVFVVVLVVLLLGGSESNRSLRKK
jgi:hypothetical protein